MNQNRKKSSQSSPVSRSVTLVDPPPFEAYFASNLKETGRDEPRKSNEFTASEAAIKMRMSRNSAKIRLDRDVKSGILSSRPGRIEGKPVTFYSVV